MMTAGKSAFTSCIILPRPTKKSVLPSCARSLWFDNNHNFGVYGHQKFKVGAIRSFGNVLAYVTDFAGKWTAPGEQGNRPNGMWDNKVIFAPNVNATYHDCSPWYAHGNALYGPEVVVTGGSCKGRTYTVPEVR